MSTTPRLPPPPGDSTQQRGYIPDVCGYLPSHAQNFANLWGVIIDPLAPRDVAELIRIRNARFLDCYP